MKKLILMFWALTLNLSATDLGGLYQGGAESVYQELSSEEKIKYEARLYEQVALSQQKLNQILTTFKKAPINPQHILLVSQIQNAIEVKMTLIRNFLGTASLKSGVIRGKLLELLKKESLHTADLAAFQLEVAKEKEQIKKALERK